MTYMVSVREMINKGVWETFCDMRGINVWAVNEGLLSEDDEFVIEKEEMIKLRLER